MKKNVMMLVALLWGGSALAQQVTGLAGWNIVLDPGQQTDVQFRYTASPAGDRVRTLSLDPALLINGKPPAGRVGTIAVTLKLPAGVPAFISSNRDFTAGQPDSVGRAVYEWNATDLYPTTITAKWSTIGVNLAVGKAMSPEAITAPGQECTITLSITNRGNTAVQDILLRDTFATSDFEGISPVGEFSLSKGNDSRQRLVWEKAIPSLPAGQTTSVQYRIRYTGQTNQILNFRLQPTEVFAGESLVASSGRITIHQLTGAVKITDTTQTKKPAIPLGMGSIIAGIGAGAFVFLRRQRAGRA